MYLSRIRCGRCGRPPLYYSACDTFGCPECDVWTEKPHDAATCAGGKCDGRFESAPERPSLYVGKTEDIYHR